MSTNINANVLKSFIIKTIGSDKLTASTAQKYGVDAGKYAEANVDENAYLELDEILDDSELYEQFAVMYNEEVEQKRDAKNEEAEKEEQAKVKDKNESGV